MEIDKIMVVINKISYQGIENTSTNWNKCELCDFYKKGKCVANNDLIRLCNAFDNVYWQDTLIAIKNEIESKDNFTIMTDMINNLKKEGIYSNEGF